MSDRGLHSRVSGSVVLQVGALELLTRVSMQSVRATSALSSLHEFRTQEAETTGGKQWNWKYLRDQFDQNNLEGLYRKYDDTLRETLMYIFLSLLIIFSTIHIALVLLGTYLEQTVWDSTYIAVGSYFVRIIVPAVLLWKSIYNPMKRKYFWVPILITFVIVFSFIMSDISTTIFSSIEDISLRPAYGTMVLLSIYVFLPMRNNYLVIIFGILATVTYLTVFSTFTYNKDTSERVVVKVISDAIFFLGVNLMGVYFRLMNEIVTRRSFLDRRAYVESTLKLKFEKDQEERLMLSILPEHIVSRVRQDIRNLFLGLQSNRYSTTMKSFNEYVEEHDNVSILYADVVNYTRISTTLSPMRMVELLNELFGRFDEASEEHDVLRIKFLGDCYYCVSGIPKPTPLHGKNCVDLGFEMIRIIQDVREKRALDIDMRIGVHSGKILSGLIGIKKWQFDIWSKDVTIASKMESTGKAGKVHITKQTLELILNFAREYIIEPNFESQNDPLIMKNKLETYLLSKPPRVSEYRNYRRVSLANNQLIKKASSAAANSRRSENRSTSNVRRTTTWMDENLVEYQQMLKAADAQMTKEIEEMTKNGKEYFRKEASLNRCSLMYSDFEQEKTFLQLPDPLFKYYITCCLVIFILILATNALTTHWFVGFSWYSWVLYILFLIGLIIMQPLSWFQFLWLKYKGVEEPRNTFLRLLHDTSTTIIRSMKIRAVIYLLVSFGLATCSIINILGCSEISTSPPAFSVLSDCVSSWHATQCWALALLLNFLFSRVFFVVKWFVAALMTGFYLWLVWDAKDTLFFYDSTWNVGLDPRMAHTLAIVFITINLYWIDRTTEYRNRIDHLWQLQLGEEQKEAETMLKVNKMLLENILPTHVIQVYLDLNRSIDELYYEKYDNVAVMFASLTDYKLGLEEDVDMNDKRLLKILDEAISDFDRLLLMEDSNHKVEKIKMAGWTYMAACGLDPNRRESFDSTSYGSYADRNQNSQYNTAIVMTMINFAAAMMLQLQNFNRGSFQNLNLRIGISNGQVAAGVVGSLKPLYDIWGHAVNMASRMDSTGITGKIQVTENTATILDECGILTSYRGETFVKGAGYLKTYFVPLDENFNFIKKYDSKRYYETIHRSPSDVSDYDTTVRLPYLYSDKRFSFNVEDNAYVNLDNESDESSEPDVVETRC